MAGNGASYESVVDVFVARPAFESPYLDGVIGQQV